MCWTSLPGHLNSKNEIEANFPDDSQYGNTWYGRPWRRFRKWIKPHTAFSHRDIHWYHRWRKQPITLLALFGKGDSRWENEIMAIRSVNTPVCLYFPSSNSFYLSRVQYWCDWHVQLQWPLFFSFHFQYGRRNTDGVQFYIGAKRDADGVFWFPAVFIGRTWK